MPRLSVPTVDAPPAGLASRLRLVVTRMARRLRQQADSSVSPTQLSVLATVERRGPLPLGDLAAIERVQPPTITAAVTRLVDQGLVTRRSDDDDRRVVRVEITPDGRRLLERSRSRKTAYLERRLAALAPAEVATLTAAAEILERVLEEEERPSR